MYRLLLVDDEAIVKISMQKIIDWETTDFMLVGMANSGLTALDFVKTTPVDAVITDLQMPGMDGVELITVLRERGFQGPILALSNYSDYALVRGALTAGAFDYLLKVNLNPENLKSFLQKMADLIREKTDRMHEVQRKDDLIKTQQRALHLASLRNFFLETQDAAPQPDSGILLPDNLFPATVCTVLINKESGIGSTAIKFLKPVVEEIFEDISPFFTIDIHQNELLCLVSEASMQSSGKKIKNKLIRLDKQISIYFSAGSLITYTCGAKDLITARKMYHVCTHSYERQFYHCSETPMQIILGGQQIDWVTIRSNYISSAISHMHNNAWDSILLETADFIELCSKVHVPPASLMDAISCIIWYGYDLKYTPWSKDDAAQLHLRLKNCRNTTQLQQYLQELFTSLPRDEIEKTPIARKEIQQAVQYVNEFYMKKLTLEEVADHVGLNREYLCRLFRAETGDSMFHYITEVRMRKAADLLLADKSLLIKEVALSVGIDDPYFFSKKFKAFWGISPTNYHDHMAAPLD